jgi:transcriptional regulator with XRE-family HTH domain
VDGIGQRLREERQLRGWSQRDLARETGVNPDTISGIETEQHEPRPSTLRKLAEGLGLEVRDFFAEPALPKAKAPNAGQLDQDDAAMLLQALENARKLAQPLIEQDDQTIAAYRQALERMKGGIGVSDAYFVEENPELADVSPEQAEVVDLALEREQRRRKLARSG